MTSKVAILLYVAIFSVLGQSAMAQTCATSATLTPTVTTVCAAAGATSTVLSFTVGTTPANGLNGATVRLYRNGNPIEVNTVVAGASSTTLTITDPNAPIGTNGYDVVVLKTGCSNVQTAPNAVQVTVLGTPTISVATATSTICSGQNGSFNVVITGPVAGTLSLTYIIANTATTTTVSGIAANSSGTTVVTITPNPAPVQTTTYQITAVASSNGCAPGVVAAGNTHTVTVNIPPPVGNLGTPNPVCQGGNLVITATPGTISPTATYQWYKNGVAVVNGATGQGSTISGANTAVLTITNAQPNDAGQYYFQVCSTDPAYAACSNGCASTNVVTAVVNALPTATFSPVSASGCIGATNTFNVAFTGTAPFNYTWQRVGPGGTVTGTVSNLNTTSTTLNFTPTQGGTYTYSVLSVSDFNCVNTVNNTSTVSLSVSSFSAPVSVGGGVQTVCFGGNTSRTFTPAGAATTTFSFSLAGPVTASGTRTTTFTLSGLTAGTYTLTANDGACTIFVPFTIPTYPQFTVTPATTAAISCFGGQTSATVTVGGGTAGDLYTISLGGVVGYTGVIAGTYTFTNISAGALAAVVTNTSTANNCAVTSTLNVLQPSQIVPNGVPAENAISCFGGTTVINATVTGGNTAGTYTYTLSGGGFVSGSSQTRNAASGVAVQFTGLTGGTYTLTVVDANGCTGVQNNIGITPATQITGNAVAGNAVCSGGAGTITVNYTGGGATTGARTFSIAGPTPQSVSAAAASSTYTFTNVTPGTYTVTITDSRSCSQVVGTVTVNAPQAITATTTITQPICAGGTGTLTIGNIQGGTTAGTNILWTLTSATGATTTATGNVIAPIAAGTYTLSAREGNCVNQFVAGGLVVSAPNPIVATFTNTVLTCNANTATVTVSATGGSTATRTFQLVNANTSAVFGTATNNTGSATFSGVPAGLYNWIVTSGGCTLSSDPGVPSTQINIATYTSPSVSGGTVTDVTCFGGTNGQIRVTGAGGVGSRTYTIIGGTVSGTSNTTGAFNGLSAGVYTITVTDQYGCAGSAAAFTVGGGTASGTGAPNLVLSSSASSNVFAPPVSSVNIEYGVANVSGNAATGVVLRVSKPTADYTITLNTANTDGTWSQTANTTTYVEFTLVANPQGLAQISCGTFVPLRVSTVITRTAAATGKGTFAVTGTVRSSVTDSFPADNSRVESFEAR